MRKKTELPTGTAISGSWKLNGLVLINALLSMHQNTHGQASTFSCKRFTDNYAATLLYRHILWTHWSTNNMKSQLEWLILNLVVASKQCTYHYGWSIDRVDVFSGYILIRRGKMFKAVLNTALRTRQTWLPQPCKYRYRWMWWSRTWLSTQSQRQSQESRHTCWSCGRSLEAWEYFCPHCRHIQKPLQGEQAEYSDFYFRLFGT